MLVLYIFGVAFTQLARDTSAEVYFQDMAGSMATLLLNGIFLDSVAQVVQDIGQGSVLLSPSEPVIRPLRGLS